MNTAVILLGSNVGEPAQNLANAIFEIEAEAGNITRSSQIYETEPWGKKDQPDFYNQVIEVLTKFNPREFLNILLEIEKSMGRKRNDKWGPRIIDLDILYFNNNIINEEGLTIPHPHLHERKFALKPLVEILPGFIHPVFGKTNKILYENLNDDLSVRPLTPDISMKRK